jgi:hypothetical protein
MSSSRSACHLVALCAAGWLTCCSQLAGLPDVTKLPDRSLSKDRAQRKVTVTAESAQKQQNQAVREIEKSSRASQPRAQLY